MYRDKYFNSYNDFNDLYENVSIGGQKASRFAKQKPHQTAAEIRAQQAAARQAAETFASSQRAKDEKRKAREALISPLPSGGVPPTQRSLRGKKGLTPAGLARSKRDRLKALARKPGNLSIEQLKHLDKRIERLTTALGYKNKWGVKSEEISYLLNHLIEEGYANSFESAISIAENMSDDWMVNILYE